MNKDLNYQLDLLVALTERQQEERQRRDKLDPTSPHREAAGAIADSLHTLVRNQKNRIIQQSEKGA